MKSSLAAMVLISCCLVLVRPVVAAQDDRDQQALESLVNYGRPLDGDLNGLSIEERRAAWERGFDRVSNVNERLVQMYEIRFHDGMEPARLSQVLAALRIRKDLTAQQLGRLIGLLQTPQAGSSRQSVNFYEAAVSGVLAVISDYPAEAHRSTARNYLQDANWKIVLAALYCLEQIGTLEDLQAAYAVVDKKRRESAGYDYDPMREALISKYNEFARRLSQPVLPESRLLTSDELRQLRQAPKDKHEALIKSFLASTGHQRPEPGVNASGKVTGNPSFLTAAPVAATGKQPQTAAMVEKDRNWKFLGLALIVIIALVFPFLVIRRPRSG